MDPGAGRTALDAAVQVDKEALVFMMRGSVLAKSGSVVADQHPERLHT